MSSCRVVAEIHKSAVDLTITGETSSLGELPKRIVDETTSFDLGSITKILATTSIIMKLVESKQLSVEDKVSKFLDAWNTDEKRDIQIQHLLSHNSGLEPWRPFYISCSNPEEVHQKIAELPLMSSIGTKFRYSDLGFMTLGRIVEVVCSSRIDESFYSIIATPMGLDGTRYSLPRDLNNVAATSIGDEIEKRMVDFQFPYAVPEKSVDFSGWRTHILSGEINDGNSFHCFSGVAGHAGLFSTTRDLITYTQTLLSSFQGDGFFSGKVMNEFFSATSEPSQGLGFKRWAVSASKAAYGHFGFPGTALVCEGTTGEALIFLTNRLHTRSSYEMMDQIWAGDYEIFKSRVNRA